MVSVHNVHNAAFVGSQTHLARHVVPSHIAPYKSPQHTFAHSLRPFSCSPTPSRFRIQKALQGRCMYEGMPVNVLGHKARVQALLVNNQRVRCV
jgi:hypothetical protein